MKTPEHFFDHHRLNPDWTSPRRYLPARDLEAVRPVISWPGGKRLLAKQIVPLLSPHRCYVEVFGGGLAVLCAKERSAIEIINDIDQNLIRFYRVVVAHLDALLQEIEFLPASRGLFMDFRDQPGLTDIQRAARWWYLNVNSFGGFGEHLGTGKKCGGASLASRCARFAALCRLNARLDAVLIENLDWRQCLAKYDDPRTCFYLDPPYVMGAQNLYAVKWGEKDHRALAETIHQLKAHWVLSYCDSPLVRSLYRRCRIRQISRPKGIGNNHGHAIGVMKELIITK